MTGKRWMLALLAFLWAASSRGIDLGPCFTATIFGVLPTDARVPLFASFGSAMTQGSRGLYLSVTCAEDVAFIREEDIPAAVAGTFLGDFRIRQQIAACAEWPEMALPLSFLEPVVSDVPVLAFSGSLDPTTPPVNGEEVISHLSRGRHLVMPGAGHGTPVGMQGAGCVADLVTDFVNAGAAEGLDASCLANLWKPPFVTGF